MSFIAPWAELNDDDREALQRAMNQSPDVPPQPALTIVIDPDVEGAQMRHMLQVAKWRAETWTAALTMLRHDRADMQSQYDAWKDELDNWRTTVMWPLERGIAFMESNLKGFATMVRDLTDDNIKTIALPGGRVTTTKREPTIEVTDETAFVAWAKANPNQAGSSVEWRPAIVMKEVRAIANIRDGKVITVDGEQIPGLGVRAGTLSASVVTA